MEEDGKSKEGWWSHVLNSVDWMETGCDVRDRGLAVASRHRNRTISCWCQWILSTSCWIPYSVNVSMSNQSGLKMCFTNWHPCTLATRWLYWLWLSVQLNAPSWFQKKKKKSVSDMVIPSDMHLVWIILRPQMFDVSVPSQSSMMESWNSFLLESKMGKRSLVSFIWY